MWLHRCTALEQIGKQFEVQKIAGFPSSSRHKFFASKNYYLMGQKVLNKKPKQKQKQEHRETGRVIEMVGDTSFGKTICSICYEDLKPLSEYLQAITPCGHVFHEHCLQRWFGYCSSAKKKRSCPVCKQTCSAKNVNRLYFQSVGDSNDQNLTQPKNESQGKDIQDAKKEIDNQISPVQLESNGTGTIQTDDPYSTSHCNAIIDGMQGVDGRIYRDAQDLFQNPNWRKTFISFKSEKRLPWLKFMLPSVP